MRNRVRMSGPPGDSRADRDAIDRRGLGTLPGGGGESLDLPLMAARCATRLTAIRSLPLKERGNECRNCDEPVRGRLGLQLSAAMTD